MDTETKRRHTPMETTKSYDTHAFRPIPGNAQFCADCPRGSSYGATVAWHQGHEPVALTTAVLAAERIPTEYLWSLIEGRPCHTLRQYDGTESCSTHRAPVGHLEAAPASRFPINRCARAETTRDCSYNHRWYEGRAYIGPWHPVAK